MEWRASEVSKGWKTKLVVVDARGVRKMCSKLKAVGKGADTWTEAEELICRAFTPVPETSLADKWEAEMAAVEVEEIDRYLQGKSAGSAGGPSLMRYGDIKHGSKALKQAVAVYLTATLQGALGSEEEGEEEEEHGEERGRR